MGLDGVGGGEGTWDPHQTEEEGCGSHTRMALDRKDMSSMGPLLHKLLADAT